LFSAKTGLYLIAIAIAVVVVGVVIATLVPKNKAETDIAEPEPTTSQVVETVFEYLPDEMLKLHAYGYTTEEILAAEEIQKPADVLVEEAKVKIAEIQSELTSGTGGSLVDPALAGIVSAILSNQGLDKIQPLANSGDWTSEVRKENIDYVKLPTYGSQLFIKLDITGFNDVLMSVEPERWVELKQSGNIVVEYIVTFYNGNEIITSVEEVQP